MGVPVNVCSNDPLRIGGYNQNDKKGGHSLHFDMDSPYRGQNGEWLFPLLTCVVFLSDAVGGPTLILNQTRSGPLAERGWLVRPDRAGTVYCFDAKLLHGVLPTACASCQRKTVRCPRKEK